MTYLARLDDLFIGLRLVSGTLDEEDETHGGLVVLSHENALVVAIV